MAPSISKPDELKSASTGLTPQTLGTSLHVPRPSLLGLLPDGTEAQHWGCGCGVNLTALTKVPSQSLVCAALQNNRVASSLKAP